MRSDDCVDRLYHLQRIPGETAAYAIFRCGEGESSDLFVEQLHHSAAGHRAALQMSLAGRIVFGSLILMPPQK